MRAHEGIAEPFDERKVVHGNSLGRVVTFLDVHTSCPVHEEWKNFQ